MAGSVNKAIIMGNLARDPEVRSFDDGNKVCNLRIITNETWKDREGQRQDKAEGHNVVIRNERIIETAEKYLQKGSLVYIEGKITTRKYTDKDGAERYVTEIEVPKFNGVMTMVGGRGGDSEGGDRHFDSSQDRGGNGGGNRGGGGGRDEGRSERGGYGGGSGGGRGDDRGGSRGGQSQSGGRGGFADDLDDDVPF